MPSSWRLTRLLLLTATVLAVSASSAFAATDLALHAPAVASSTYSSSYPASNAVDGNTSTRWAAGKGVPPDKIYVDLGADYNLTSASIQWGVDYPTSYQIQTSEDHVNWTTIYSDTAGNGGTDTPTLTGTGRYVQVVGLNQNDTWGNSIYSLSVYGSPVTPPPPPSGATVSSAPTGPAAPAGGWAVRYADAFGSCLTDTTSRCSAGYVRSDGTLDARSHANGAGNSNGISSLTPSMVDVTTQGLDLHCNPASVTPNPYGNPFSCGAATGNSYGPAAPSAFSYTPGGSKRFVLQAVVQMPPNQGNMDPSFWTNGPADNPEVDNPELWGWSHSVPTGATNTWCGFQFGDPAVPFDSGGGTGNVQATFCQTAGANFDPSNGFHTWTLDMNGTVFTSYIDGVKLGSKTYSGFNSSARAFELLLMMELRQNNQGAAAKLPAGGNDMVVRSVEVYAPAGQAADNGPMIVPGTVVQ